MFSLTSAAFSNLVFHTLHLEKKTEQPHNYYPIKHGKYNDKTLAFQVGITNIFKAHLTASRFCQPCRITQSHLEEMFPPDASFTLQF